MKDPYLKKLKGKAEYYQKRTVELDLVVILEGKVANRGLCILPQKSRAVVRGEVHELILTVEEPRNSTVDKIAYLGFGEVKIPGVIACGDKVCLGEERLGKVVGFDETHMPNHLNIVIKVDSYKDGRELLAYLGESVNFKLQQ